MLSTELPGFIPSFVPLFSCSTCPLDSLFESWPKFDGHFGFISFHLVDTEEQFYNNVYSVSLFFFFFLFQPDHFRSLQKVVVVVVV